MKHTINRSSYQQHSPKLLQQEKPLVLTREQQEILMSVEAIAKRLRLSRSRSNAGTRTTQLRAAVNEYLRSL